ncbi:MAG: carboxypeptidase regulatory-like domain-containing protein [Bryobacterales bacterium]|nr:carboxypeptidase regulatory-like domain-containing protein [Bryobacterales bacterium]
MEEAAEEVKFLNAWAGGSTPTLIQGQVYPASNFRDRVKPDQRQAQLSGSTVIAIDSRGQRFATSADALGRSQITEVTPGAYSVTVHRPSFRSDRPQYAVTVPAGGCAEINARLGFDGQVSGRLAEPDGRAVQPIKVQLIPAEGEFITSVNEAMSREDGAYKFVGVPPGRYRVTVNERQEPNASIPYIKASSREFALGEAGTVTNLDLELSSRMHSRTITAEVSWADGSPATLAHAWCAARGYATWRHLITDSSGRIQFDALDGLTYEVRAAATSNYFITSRRRFSAKPLQVPPGQSATVRLILSIPPAKQ